MGMKKIRLIAAALLVSALTAPSLSDEIADNEIAPEISGPVVLTVRAAYLFNVTGSAELRINDADGTTGIVARGPGRTRLQSGRLRVAEGKAVITAGRMRIYLEKGDEVELVIDNKVVCQHIVVPAGYPRPLILRNGNVKQKIEPSGTYFSTSK